jgi:hypothetical protein
MEVKRGVFSSSVKTPSTTAAWIALAQPKGTKILPALPKIFKMLAGRLPVCAADERG